MSWQRISTPKKKKNDALHLFFLKLCISNLYLNVKQLTAGIIKVFCNGYSSLPTVHTWFPVIFSYFRNLSQCWKVAVWYQRWHKEIVMEGMEIGEKSVLMGEGSIICTKKKTNKVKLFFGQTVCAFNVLYIKCMKIDS